MTVTFQNGVSIGYINAMETEEYWGGSNRRTLTFTCASDVISVDDLNTILSNSENTTSLTLTNEELDITNIYDGYTMKLKVGIDKELTQPEGPDAPAQYIDRLVFKLGRPTYIEQRLASLGITAY